MVSALQAVRGMNDVLPDEAPLWERFEDAARSVFAQYGYRNMRVPIVEPTALFVRGIGEHTDVVEHEMYTFEDKLNGESLTLRPEATAGIVRARHRAQPRLRAPAADLDRRPDVPPRAAAKGPLSAVPPDRRGSARLRGPDVDAEQIVMTGAPVAGARPCRYPAADQFDRRCPRAARSSQRADRAFRAPRGRARRRCAPADCTPTRCASSTARTSRCGRCSKAPRGSSTSSPEASLAHFEGLQSLLTDAGLAFEINPRLVRGLDYYNRSVFEFVPMSDGQRAQDTIAGGGRYDGLFAQLGGQGHPRLRLRHRSRTRGPCCSRNAAWRRRRAARLRRPCGAKRPRHSRAASRKRCATPVTRSS
jgi:histidyl-tRNA synthetase